VHYRKSLVKHTLAKINDTSDIVDASSICKSVDVLLAIRWIKDAWDAVTPDTIKNCFRRCGISPQTATTAESENPFSDLDAEAQSMSSLNELVVQMGSDMTADEYVTVEEDMATSFTFDGASIIGEKGYVQQLCLTLLVQQRDLLWKKRNQVMKKMKKMKL